MLDRISEQEGVGVFACNAVKKRSRPRNNNSNHLLWFKGWTFSVSKMPTKQFTYPMFVCFGFVYSGQVGQVGSVGCWYRSDQHYFSLVQHPNYQLLQKNKTKTFRTSLYFVYMYSTKLSCFPQHLVTSWLNRSWENKTASQTPIISFTYKVRRENLSS